MGKNRRRLQCICRKCSFWIYIIIKQCVFIFQKNNPKHRTCGITTHVNELIGPIALLDPVVVSQTRFAWERIRRTVFAFHVVGAARGTVRVQTKLEFASWGTDRHNCKHNFYMININCIIIYLFYTKISNIVGHYLRVIYIPSPIHIWNVFKVIPIMYKSCNKYYTIIYI